MGIRTTRRRPAGWITPFLALLAATLIYAGVLTADADPVSGWILLVLGTVAVVQPVMTAYRFVQQLMGKEPAPQRGPRRRPNPVHLKIVERDQEDRPTIH